MLEQLTMKAHLESMGYIPFIPTKTYFSSGITYEIASFQNRETDPTIYSIKSDDGEVIKVWSNSYNNLVLSEDDVITFKDNLYMNSDRFVIRFDSTQINSVVKFHEENSFQRQCIRGIDDRYDLGNLRFIVSDAGILYSLYTHPSNKTINRNGNTINLFNQDSSITYNIKQKVIGEYGHPFLINAVHVMPTGSFSTPNVYNNWE